MRSKKGSHQRGGFKPFRKGSHDQAYWEKAKERRESKENSQYPYDGNKGYPSYDNGKGKGRQEKGKSKTFAEKTPAIQPTAPSTEPTYAGWTDEDWDPSWNWSEQGWYSSHESSSTGQAMMAFHEAYVQHEKDTIHEKLIQAHAVSEQSMTATAKQRFFSTKLVVPVINPQHNPILDNGCTRSMGSWHAIQRFTQAIEPMKDLSSTSHIPAKTKFTFVNGETVDLAP